ncbi:hypothetical protein [Cystobacter fuscus]|uniref:hypothetical protein n=1 Tax=Cystobacter fuscus TaxID=43 RepID=UPI003B2864D2
MAELEARPRRNSTNSSKPPSSDPPGVRRPPECPRGAVRVASPATSSTSGSCCQRRRSTGSSRCPPRSGAADVMRSWREGRGTWCATSWWKYHRSSRW